MRRPYLEQLREVLEVRACLVDGEWIRNHLDVDFTNGAHHYSRPYIPSLEVWIDREAPGSNELEYLIEHQLHERELMERGVHYLRALRMANHRERQQRRSVLDPRLVSAAAAEQRGYVFRRELGEVDGDRLILVNGRAVRDLFDLNFTQGGHHARYRFIPSRQIWIDDAVVDSEREYVIAHEVHELHLMRQGMKYYPAHDHALELERKLRRRETRARRRA